MTHSNTIIRSSDKIISTNMHLHNIYVYNTSTILEYWPLQSSSFTDMGYFVCNPFLLQQTSPHKYWWVINWSILWHKATDHCNCRNCTSGKTALQIIAKNGYSQCHPLIQNIIFHILHHWVMAIMLILDARGHSIIQWPESHCLEK